AAGDQSKHLHLTFGEISWTRTPSPATQAGRFDHSRGRIGVKPAGLGLSLKPVCGARRSERPSVRTILDPPSVCIRTRQDARRHGQLGCGGPSVVAAAVAAFVMLAGQRGQCGQRWDAIEDPLAVISVQPRLIAFGRTQWACLIPDGARHPDPSKIVEVSRDTYGVQVLTQAEHPGSGRCKITNARGMTMQPRA